MRRRPSLQLTLTLATLLTFVSAGAATSQTLYGAANNSPGGAAESSLYTIDPTDGTATLVGPTGFENVTGMAFLGDGRLVATFRADSLTPPDIGAGLIEIDPDTGAGTLIGIVGTTPTTCGRMPDITYDEATDTLFAYGDFCATAIEGLFTIDPDSGLGTSIGASGFFGGGNGMAIDPSDGTIYAAPFDVNSLVTIDPMTGMATEIPGTAGNVPNRIGSLAFHPDTGELFGSWNDSFGSGNSFLVTIDTATGVGTTIGQSVLGLDALVFEPMPQPPILEIPTLGEIGLVGLVLLLASSALVLLRRRV